jgi:hypothetical protein
VSRPAVSDRQEDPEYKRADRQLSLPDTDREHVLDPLNDARDAT